MTDNTQAEIDKILRRLVNRVERYAFEKWDSQPKDYPPGVRDVLFTQDMEDEAAEAILDWHNKQIEAVLDRLEAQKGTPIALLESKKYEHGVIPLRAIQAERDKLKEPKV